MSSGTVFEISRLLRTNDVPPLLPLRCTLICIPRLSSLYLPNYTHNSATHHHRRTTHLIKSPLPQLPQNLHNFLEMRFATLSIIAALFAAVTMAAAPLRSVIISFPNDTPDHVVEEAKEGIRKDNGVITHEYSECSLCDTFGR
jgi:hypothetical protein